MKLSEMLDTWFSKRKLRASTKARFRHELAIWRRLGGAETADAIDVSAWQTAAVADGLQPRTINSVCASVALLCNRVGGVSLAWEPTPGGPLKRYTPSLDQVDRMLRVAVRAARRPPEWWQRLLAVAYVTGVRRSDLLRLDVAAIIDGEISFSAGKTDKEHVIPLPLAVLRLMPDSGPICRVGIKPLRRVLREWCDRASVPRFTLKAMRRLSAREWERAHAGAGAVILGHAIPGWSKATPAYMDPAEILRAGLPRLRLPASLVTETDADDEATLTATYRRLPPQEKATVRAVVSAMGR